MLDFIHADWPAYPEGYGIRSALEALAQFESDTEFEPIDYIDQCTLFVVTPYVGDEYSEENRHLALWDQDIIELVHEGLINGVNAPTSYVDGVSVTKHIDYEIHPVSKRWIMALSNKGQDAAPFFKDTMGCDSRILAEVDPLLFHSKGDSAIRLATITVESSLKQKIGHEEMYGKALIKKCFKPGSGELIPEDDLSFDSANTFDFLNDLFDTYRNPFAHNARPTYSQEVGDALSRCSTILALLDTLRKTP